MVKLFLSLLISISLIACSTPTTPIPNPTDCGNPASTFKQKTRVKKDTCVAIDYSVLHPEQKRLWGKGSLFWPQNTTLKVLFLNGDSTQINKAWKRFQVVDSICNLNFVKVTSGNSDIRVYFDVNDGHWSYIGRDNKQIPQTEKTMNLGLLASDAEDEYDRVVIHETLHACGFWHEHQHPFSDIPWDIPKVLAYYRQTQGWSDQQIHQQVLDRQTKEDFIGSSFDKDSIMEYPIPAELTTNGFSVGWNYKLSPCDVAEIQKIYPLNK